MDIETCTEGSTFEIVGDIVDGDDAAVPAAQLTEATLTLYDWGTAVLRGSPLVGVINDRYAQDVLNNHDVTIDEDGHFVWSVQPEDNPIVTQIRQIERHRALLHFAWLGGEFNVEIEIQVTNLNGVVA